jgi:hypothetical protein
LVLALHVVGVGVTLLLEALMPASTGGAGIGKCPHSDKSTTVDFSTTVEKASRMSDVCSSPHMEE